MCVVQRSRNGPRYMCFDAIFIPIGVSFPNVTLIISKYYCYFFSEEVNVRV